MCTKILRQYRKFFFRCFIRAQAKYQNANNFFIVVQRQAEGRFKPRFFCRCFTYKTFIFINMLPKLAFTGLPYSTGQAFAFFEAFYFGAFIEEFIYSEG